MVQEVINKNEMDLVPQFKGIFASGKKEITLIRFDSAEMPKEKDEDWRYTPINKVKLEDFSPLNPTTTIECSGLSRSLIEKGVILTDINTALDKYPAAQNNFSKFINSEEDKLLLLNSSHFNHGIFLYVPKNIEIDEPIRVVFKAIGKTSISHNLIILESNCKINFIEEYYDEEKEGMQLNSAVTEVFANTNSKINFYHLNKCSKNTYNFANITGNIDRNSEINWISGCFGGKINRLKIDTNFAGEGSGCTNLGIFLGKNEEHIDFTTNAFHKAQNTSNNIIVDGILKDSSSSIYRGLIRIEESAQKTNSYLSNHTLKIGDKTLANSIPSLKIDANDVKASHEATVGQIDEEHLFYLMARGLSRNGAEKMIVEGFFEPTIQKIPLEELREKIRELVKK